MNEHTLMSILTRGLAVLLGCLSLAVSPMRALGQSSPTQTQSESHNQQATVSDQQIPPAIAKELDAMKRRIAQLEAELKQHQAAEQPVTAILTRPLLRPILCQGCLVFPCIPYTEMDSKTTRMQPISIHTSRLSC